VRSATLLFYAFATVCLGFIAAAPAGLIIATILGTPGDTVKWGEIVLLAAGVICVLFLWLALYFIGPNAGNSRRYDEPGDDESDGRVN
jgi:hypothetical protein